MIEIHFPLEDIEASVELVRNGNRVTGVRIKPRFLTSTSAANVCYLQVLGQDGESVLMKKVIRQSGKTGQVTLAGVQKEVVPRFYGPSQTSKATEEENVDAEQ